MPPAWLVGKSALVGSARLTAVTAQQTNASMMRKATGTWRPDEEVRRSVGHLVEIKAARAATTADHASA